MRLSLSSWWGRKSLVLGNVRTIAGRPEMMPRILNVVKSISPLIKKVD